MLSLDPATVTDRRYPLLFQTGESAYGKPLIDAQHPHDFLMGLSVQYARPLNPRHDAAVVLRAGGRSRARSRGVPPPRVGLRTAASHPGTPLAGRHPHRGQCRHCGGAAQVAAHGGERVLRHRARRESLEYRLGRDEFLLGARIGGAHGQSGWRRCPRAACANPERLEEGDVVRTTASLQYTRPLERGTSWSTSFIWGRNHQIAHQRDVDSWLVETLYPATRRDFVTGRFEVVDKDELFAGQHDIEHRLEDSAAGTHLPHTGLHRWVHTRHPASVHDVETGLGVNVSAYRIPAAIQPYYGEHPWGWNVYLRVRLK